MQNSALAGPGQEPRLADLRQVLFCCSHGAPCLRQSGWGSTLLLRPELTGVTVATIEPRPGCNVVGYRLLKP